MSLNLKPTFSDTNVCSEIIFSDETGTTYQNKYAISNINSSVLLTSLINCSEEKVYNFTQLQAQSLANKTLTHKIEDYTESNVIEGNYIVFFNTTNQTLYSIDNNTDTLTVTGLLWNHFTEFDYVLIENKYYKVKSITQNTNSLTVKLTENYIGEESISNQSLVVGFNKIFYHAHVCTLNLCLHQKIAKVSTESCSCRDKSIEKLSKNLFMFFAIEVHMETLNYKQAQEIINSLKMFCQSDKICNC